MRLRFEKHKLGLWDWNLDLKKKVWEMGLDPPSLQDPREESDPSFMLSKSPLEIKLSQNCKIPVLTLAFHVQGKISLNISQNRFVSICNKHLVILSVRLFRDLLRLQMSSLITCGIINCRTVNWALLCMYPASRACFNILGGKRRKGDSPETLSFHCSRIIQEFAGAKFQVFDWFKPVLMRESLLIMQPMAKFEPASRSFMAGSMSLFRWSSPCPDLDQPRGCFRVPSVS